MKIRKLSLRTRIFFSMILSVLLASVLIATISIIQYNNQIKDYNKRRFERKEHSTLLDIRYELSTTKKANTTRSLPIIFEGKIDEIASVHRMNIAMYNLNGRLLVHSGRSRVFKNPLHIPSKELEELVKKEEYKEESKLDEDLNKEGYKLQVSYSFIHDETTKEKIGIVKLQYLQSNTSQRKDLGMFLYRLGMVYTIMFVIAIVFAYFLSRYITRSIDGIIEKIGKTGLDKRNEKITVEGAPSEILKLIKAYNNMVDALEASAAKLAKSEREQAWREMAKQVAHEIKNPLTPMRLSVQSFERRFDPEDPNIREKLSDYSNVLIQQIDVMSSIASAFSDFAQMPTKKKERIEVVGVVKRTLDVFNKDYLTYNANINEVHVDLDKTQLIRIVTNIVKNAIQATEEVQSPKVEVFLRDEKSYIEIEVSDNGKGISDEFKELVYEPKFTTKSSGMGLGLPMIKKIVESYGGTIVFVSELGKGTTFTIQIPKT